MRMRSPALAAAFVLAAASAEAADHLLLEEGLPLSIEDAYPTAYRGREVQGVFRYDHRTRDREGDSRFTLEPRFEVGAFPNTELTLAVPDRLGDASDTEQGDFRVGALYNFTAEGIAIPALSLSGEIAQPFGYDSGSPEFRLKAIAMKSFGGAVPRRIHLNVAWDHVFDAASEERSDRYEIGLGYDQPLTADLVFATGLVRVQDRQRRRDENVVEAGLRYQLSPLTTVSAGTGVGIGDDSPDFRFVVGFQHSLTWPWFFDE